MGIDGFKHTKKESPSNSDAQRTLMGLQAKIALLSYQDHHPEQIVDVMHPENNDREIRGNAMTEFIGDGYADSFRGVIEDHTLQPYDIEDPEALRETLALVLGRKNSSQADETVH